MELFFNKTLFGVDDTSGEDPFNTQCQPVWIEGEWVWKLELGTCGMVVGTESFIVDGISEEYVNNI